MTKSKAAKHATRSRALERFPRAMPIGNRLRLLLSMFLPALWLTPPAPLAAQPPIPKLDHVSAHNGMSQGSVYTIVQDKMGFMWFGTEDGLSRYDGRQVITYRHEPSSSNSLSSSNFGEIIEDDAGVLWLGTWGGGLNRFDPSTGTFKHYRHDRDNRHSLSQDRIEYMAVDSSGILWIGTQEAGLNRLDPDTDAFIHYRNNPADSTSLSNDEVRVLAEDRSGDLWVGTNGGLDRWDRTTERFFHHGHDPADPNSLGSNRIRAILEDREGILWVGTRDRGLDRWDRQTGEIRHYRHDPEDPESLSDDAVSCLLEDSFGTLWVGTYRKGLNRFHRETESFIATRATGLPDGLASDRIESLYEDRGQNLWIATIGGGIHKLDLKPAKFENIEYQPSSPGGLPHPSVRVIAEDAEALWIGTDGGGLARVEQNREGFFYLRHAPNEANSLSSDRIWSLLMDSSGNLWAGSYESGLNRLVADSGTYRITRHQHDPEDSTSLSSDRIQSLLEDRDGALWLGTAKGLNRLLSPAGDDLHFVSYRHDPVKPKSLSDDYVSVLHQGMSGALWIGTLHGLNRLDKQTGEFHRFLNDPTDNQSLSSDIVLALLEDESGRELWVGTEDGGLSRLDYGTGEFQSYFVGDGLPSNIIVGILQDDAGNLWLSTSGGISRLDPESGELKNYDSTDGLHGHSFIRSSAFESPTGEMFFGSISGLASFFPDQMRDNPHPPQVALTSIRKLNEELVLDRPIESIEELELSYKDNFITFHFAALDFTAPESNQYAYRLEGFDEDWIYAANLGFASYTNLDPARYSFVVKASNSDGIWNEEGRTLLLTVTPPFWQTWWFRGSALSSLVALLWGAHLGRTAKIRKRAEELETINSVLHQEVTERRRAESEKERLIDELTVKNIEMERFTYTVSHDLKSPLVTIKGFLGLLAKDVANGRSERVETDIARIGRAADKMYRLLDELLDLSRVGHILSTYSEIDLDELFTEALESLAGRLTESGAEVIIEPDLPRVTGDHQRLLEVAQNLLDNAFKFMTEQPHPRVEVGSRRDGEETTFYVRDNGDGIEPAYHDKVFQLFERLDPRTDGTGVGLALVKRIVELHGGRIWVESEGRGRGSTFCFTLPLPEVVP